MSVTYSDTYGAVLDTGSNVQPTARPNIEIELHLAREIDTGSKLTVNAGTTVGTGVPHFNPHRPANSPR